MRIGSTRVTGDFLANTWQRIYSKTIGNDNLIRNGNLEVWTASTSSPPDNFTLFGGGASVAREASTIKIGTYSAKVTRVTNDCAIIQDFTSVKGIAYYQSKTITFGAWVYATVANRACIAISDGVTAQGLSAYHTGDSTWQWLTVTYAVAAGATAMNAYCKVNNGDTSAYFDGCVIRVAGSLASQEDLDNFEYTSLTISGLDGNTHEEYMLSLALVGGSSNAGSYYQIRPNNDSSSNYGEQALNGGAAAGTTVEAFRHTSDSSFFIGSYRTGLGYITLSDLYLYAKAGYGPRAMIGNTFIRTDATTFYAYSNGSVWNNDSDNITSLVLFSSESNGLGVGTVIELYAKRSRV